MAVVGLGGAVAVGARAAIVARDDADLVAQAAAQRGGQAGDGDDDHEHDDDREDRQPDVLRRGLALLVAVHATPKPSQ